MPIWPTHKYCIIKSGPKSITPVITVSFIFLQDILVIFIFKYLTLRIDQTVNVYLFHFQKLPHYPFRSFRIRIA